MVHKGFRSMYTLSVVFCNLFIEVKFTHVCIEVLLLRLKSFDKLLS